MNIKLRPYQVEVDRAIEACDSNRVLVVQPTGTGKTIAFTYHAISRGFRTLILNWNEELIDQCVDACRLIDPSITVGRFIGNNRDLDSQIIIASVQTLKNINNLMLVDRDFRLIVCDEAHHISPSLKRILYAFGLCDLDTAGHKNVQLIDPHFMDGRRLIGVTATPERTDGEPLRKIFHDRIDTPPLEWFIEEGFLSDLKFVSIDTGIDMSDVRSYAGDLDEKQMAQKLIDSGYINELSRIINEYLPEKKSILLYVPDVQTAKMASTLISNAGIPADYVIGAEKGRREMVINSFKRREIRVLVNCLVLKEGFDSKEVDAIILCRPTKSKLLLRQIIGRGTRPCPEKSECTIVDLVVKRRESDIIRASGIFDDLELSPSEEESMTIREKIAIQKQLADGRQLLARVVDEMRLKKELESDDNSKEKGEKIEENLINENVPDSVSMLMDTRLLRETGLDAKSFAVAYNMEKSRFTMQGDSDTPYPYQIDFLTKNTNYDEKDLEMLKPEEAQSMINIIKRQTKPTTQGQRSLLLRVYKVPEDRIPKKDIDARQLIKSLSNRRIKSGGA